MRRYGGDPSVVLPYLLFVTSNLFQATSGLIANGPAATTVANVFADIPNIGGVTCIAKDIIGNTLFVGTKTGRLLTSSFEDRIVEGGGGLGQRRRREWMELTSDDYITKFPIYSILVDERDDYDYIYVGSGDRYVSIWRGEMGAMGYALARTLGPHTGWVKAMARDGESKALYSIGCDRIECWDVSDRIDDDVRHVSTRTIHSSPIAGSTLSSDLLCLCLIEERRCLISGGVDGRVHCWSLNRADPRPTASCRIHDGRINAIVHHAPLRLIFSVGHDGVLRVSELTSDDAAGDAGVITMVSYEVDGRPRLSALCIIVDEGPRGCKLGLGTTDGKVIILRMTMNEEGQASFAEEDILEVEGDHMIYSICKSPAPSILVGHAKGLVEWDIL